MVRRGELDRRIVALAIPALGTLAIEPLYVLTDTAIVGRLGTEPLAGLALAATVLLVTVAGCNFLSFATTSRIAHHRGAGERSAAADAAVQALWLAAVIGLPLGAVLALVAPWAASVLGGQGAVLTAATTYLRISAFGLPAILIALASLGVLRGALDLRTPLVIIAVASVTNVILEIIAVFVLDLGIAGSAWSTVIVQWGAAVAYLVVLRPHLAARHTLRPRLHELAPLLRAGGHLGVRVIAMLAVIVTVTALAARVDDQTLAAHQIVFQLMSLLALALDALAIPAQTFVAEALGGSRSDEAVVVGHAATRLSLIAASAIALALVVTAPLLPHLFTTDAAVASRATAGIVVLAVLQLPAAIAFALDGVLIGAGDYRFLARGAVLMAVATAPVAVVVALWPHAGIVAVWCTLLFWMTVRAALNRWRFTSNRWTRPAVARH